MLLVGILVLILIGVGIALGITLFSIFAIFLFTGIISSSLAWGILSKKGERFFQILIWQISLLLFPIFGIIAGFATHAIPRSEEPLGPYLMIGAATGLLVGALHALFYHQVISWLFSSFIQRQIFSKTPPPKSLPPS